MTQDRVLPRPQYRTPKQGGPWDGTAEGDEHAPVQSLPSSRLHTRRDRVPRQSSIDGLFACQDTLLPLQATSE